MKRILLAGATGYLGKYILEELIKRNFDITVLVRNLSKLNFKNKNQIKVIEGQIADSESINGSCKNIDIVISTVGITRQKDGLTYMDVDYGGNKNLLEEAKKNSVQKFIYVSVFQGENLRFLEICNAKELFVEELKSSGLDYSIIRPNGFFSDITEFYNMAQKGRVYLFGNGTWKANPIHGEDLAKVCVDAIHIDKREINVGGPEILEQNQIASLAFEILSKKPKITYIPDWARKMTLNMIRTFTSKKVYGPIEFFLTVLSIDLVAPQYGKHTLKEYFTSLKKNSQREP